RCQRCGVPYAGELRAGQRWCLVDATQGGAMALRAMAHVKCFTALLLIGGIAAADSGCRRNGLPAGGETPQQTAHGCGEVGAREANHPAFLTSCRCRGLLSQ